MREIIREVAKIYLYLFAIVGVLAFGYIFVEGEAYKALALFGLMVGLVMWWYTAK